MTNIDSGKELIKNAGWILEKELKVAFQEGNYNLAVRRAQEVVELSLKAALKVLGIEYPKVHNVGTLFLQVVKKKGLDLEEAVVNKICQISEQLAEDRAPSFYGERIYTLEEAKDSLDGAIFIYNEIRKIPGLK